MYRLVTVIHQSTNRTYTLNVNSITNALGETTRFTYNELNRCTEEAIADSVNGDLTISYIDALNMLKKIDKDIWVADAPFKYFGLSVGTRMTVIRLANRELVVISPIQIDNATSLELDKLGTVSHIIAPNLYHYLFASDF